MHDVFIVSAVRTPIGRFGGALSSLGPAALAAPVLDAATDRARVDPRALELIILGHVLAGGHGQLIPRQAARIAGLPDSLDAVAVDMVCSSGMMSVMMAVAQIQSGAADLILAGGTESMSNAGFALSSRARWGYRYLPKGSEPVSDLLFRDGLSDPASGEAMGVQAERLAREEGVTRQELDQIARSSHRRAHQATEAGHFRSEIVPIDARGNTVVRDEGIRPETSLEGLGALRPAFAAAGVLTAGNSSQISDGAAALLLASNRAVQDHQLRPLARIRGSAWTAGEWWRFVESPVHAAERACSRSGADLSDIDLIENNEAFALSTYLFAKHLRIDENRLNVHGGAIAMGHPIGCSGARLLVTLVHALSTRDKVLGLAALCHGTGGGTATIVERTH